MFTLARKNLLRERTRLAVSIGGVAFAVVLMILLRGLYVAYEAKVQDYFQGMKVDAWVMQKGTADLLHSYSVLPRGMQSKLWATGGVEEPIPYLARQTGFKLNGQDVLLYLVAFDPQAKQGPGPLQMQDGRRAINDGEIIVDKVFFRKYGLHLGDHLKIRGRNLHLVGVCSGDDLVMFQFAFITYRDARALLQLPNQVNTYLLRYQPGVDHTKAASRVSKAIPGVDVKPVPQVVRENQRIINEGFLPVIRVLLVIGFIIGVAVIGLTIYSAVVEKRREYGILKAVGARPRQMLAVVATQAVSAALLGYGVGVGLALLAAQGAERWVPQFITRIRLEDVLAIGVASLLMGFVACAVPMRGIAQVDPAEVFRA